MWLMTYDDIWHSVSSTIEIKLILVLFSDKEIRPAFKWLMTCDIWHSPPVTTESFFLHYCSKTKLGPPSSDLWHVTYDTVCPLRSKAFLCIIVRKKKLGLPSRDLWHVWHIQIIQIGAPRNRGVRVTFDFFGWLCMTRRRPHGGWKQTGAHLGPSSYHISSFHKSSYHISSFHFIASRMRRDALLALQKSFTGIDNEEPERIAAYKGQEQQVASYDKSRLQSMLLWLYRRPSLCLAAV